MEEYIENFIRLNFDDNLELRGGDYTLCMGFGINIPWEDSYIEINFKWFGFWSVYIKTKDGGYRKHCVKNIDQLIGWMMHRYKILKERIYGNIR